MPAIRNRETAAENLRWWTRTHLALGSYTRRQWAERVLTSQDRGAVIAQVPAAYQAIVLKYVEIADQRKDLDIRNAAQS